MEGDWQQPPDSRRHRQQIRNAGDSNSFPLMEGDHARQRLLGCTWPRQSGYPRREGAASPGRPFSGWQEKPAPTISARVTSARTAQRGGLNPQALRVQVSPRAPFYRRVVYREQQTGSAQTRIALGVQVSPRRPLSDSSLDKRAGAAWKAADPRRETVGQHHTDPPRARG